MRFGAKGLMRTLMRVRISSDAPRCTVQFGALDPRCTMVQVHGDPNEPSLGAGAAGAPCVTLLQYIPLHCEWLLGCFELFRMSDHETQTYGLTP